MSVFSSQNINKIYITLGHKCNFSCRYCLQDAPTKAQQTEAEPSEELFRYIETLAARRSAKRDKLTVVFWGGEPLLYKATIRKIVDRLQDKVKYALVTNGRLLDEETVGFCNEHEIHVALSHDGTHTKRTRKIDVLDDEKFIELFQKLERRNVESVANAYNYDFLALFDYIESKLGETPIIVDALRITWNMPQDLYNIDVKQYEKSLVAVAEVAQKDLLAGRLSNALRMFLPVLKKLSEGKEQGANVLNCGNFYHALNVDLAGNVYTCHNSCEKLGDISEERITLAERFDKWLADRCQSCRDCDYFGLCRGGCPLETEYKHITCELNKAYYKTCIELAESVLFAYEPVDLEVDEK